MRFAFLCVICLFVTGCASLSKEECQVADWRVIGERDGAAGHTPDYLAQHVKACARVDVVPNQSLWEQGRQAGLPRYCQPSRAYEEGRAGRGLSPVCPAPQLAQLRAANDKGRNYHRIGQEISTIEREIDDVSDQLVTEPEETSRAALLRRMERLRRDIGRLQLERQRYAQL